VKFWPTVGWVLFVLDGLFLMMMLITAYSPGQDAAGRGMASGFAFFAGLVMIALAIGLCLSFRYDSPVNFAGAALLIAIPVLLLAGPAVGESMATARREREAAKQGRFSERDLSTAAAAIRDGDQQALAEVLRRRPDQTARDEAGRTLLGFAVEQSLRKQMPLDAVRALLDAGADPDQLLTPNEPAVLQMIFESSSPNSNDLLKLLLDRGANPNMHDIHGVPMLHHAKDRLVKLKLLLDHGAELDEVSEAEYQRGWTAAMALVAAGAYDEALYLVQRGADVHYKAPDGATLISLLERQKFEAGESGARLAESYRALARAVSLHASR